MLKSALYRLEKLIGEVLKNFRTTTDPDNFKRLPDQVKSVQTLSAEIKEKWVHELFSSAKEHVITRYVQYHQAGITQLSNQISRIIPVGGAHSKNATGPDPFEQILSELEQLLNFLRHQCYHYFDLDYKITIHSCRRQCAQIDEFRKELLSYSGKEIAIPLVEVIGISVQEMTDDAVQSGISYRQTEQTLNLLRMVQQLMYTIHGITTNRLAQALYRQNLNTKWFLNWYREHILLQFNKISGKREQTIFISQQIKMFTGMFVDPEKAFEPELPSADLVLLPWLYEKSGNQDKTIRAINKSNIPIQLPLNLSVPQFALFIRIFSKAGCFPDTNVSKITRFFTQYFTTKKQIHISRESFRKAFYSLDQATAAIVRDYLQKMINYLNKTYFP
ncbi:hypothetical protein PQ469_03155 [Mucilaginibacter sp. KACC 22773]|uniref:hypothetical protein n=1 Tax=Mucilaginibacter sp. KACC 22773 TaxID=3025671 RepID=UPI00236726DD|nr:hypothetical protein [Mucilaginibacter sp. KACC 22773]WDF79003.1 hypothetical protein PQ469_03155 [Mucilaginibacter sp. KACC 22773]